MNDLNSNSSTSTTTTATTATISTTNSTTITPQTMATTTDSYSSTSSYPSTVDYGNSGYYLDPNHAAYYQQYYQQYYAYTQQSGYGGDPQQQQQQYYYPQTTTTTTMNNSVPSNIDPNYLANQAVVAGYLPTMMMTTVATTSSNDQNENDDDDDPTIAKPNKPKLSNSLKYACNQKMGLNPLLYANIQQSPYFKNNLFQLKTYNEVIDEIFYSVKHLEPWEKGSRKVSGQTGMCGSVRGVGAGGIISTPFCILYKLFTLRLTRKQVTAMIRHKDSPYIRALGFMFIRFTQSPQDLWQWFEPYLDDEEQVDPKAGGGSPMTIGQMVRHLLTKLEWFSTLFPRIPRHVQLEIEKKLERYDEEQQNSESGKSKEKKRKKSNDEDGQFEDQKDYNRNKYSNRNHDSHQSRSQIKRSRSRSISPQNHHHSNKHRTKKYDDSYRSKGNSNFRY